METLETSFIGRVVIEALLFLLLTHLAVKLFSFPLLDGKYVERTLLVSQTVIVILLKHILMEYFFFFFFLIK